MTPDEDASAHYDVTIVPETKELRCTLRLTGPAATGEVSLQIPTWVPGDYSFFLLARDLFEVSAVDTASGEALAVARDGWQAWTVRGGSGDITVSWRAYAYETEFAEPCGIVDGAWGILLGGRYLHSPDWLGEATVRYHLPEAWAGTIHHPSGAEALGDDTWRYPSFEILLDTPVCMGNTTIVQRAVAGTPIYFLFVDRGVGFDEGVDAFCDQVAAVADGFRQMFGGAFPFADYTFVLSLSPDADWGLEHLTSSMCGLGPDVFTDPTVNATGVRVCAHELFHAWNVRRLRPAPLGALASQLTAGSFTEGLWMAEGFTRYYEFLSSARAGTYSLDQFFSAVVGYHSHLTGLPAYGRVSVTDASLTTYLTHSPKYPGRCNNCIDYYDKGMLIAFGLDARLRLAGDSLDAAFADFYAGHVGFGPGHPGYTTDEVIAFFEARLAGLGAWLAPRLLEPGHLSTEAELLDLGFLVEHQRTHRAGLMFQGDITATLYNVLDDSPAGRAGVAPGDVITAVNGFAYSTAALTWACSRPGAVTLGLTRGHRHLTATFSPEPHTAVSRMVWTGSDDDAARIAAWLAPAPTSLSAGQVLSVSFYENFHGIETVI